MPLSTSDFGAFHAAVHEGKSPFGWQQRLLEQIVRDKRWPRVLDLPTGAGKTTCIDIALFALALDAANRPEARWCPRRVVMVVDRRVVVDQVAERGRCILRALTTSRAPVVVEVADRLRALTRAGEDPLGVFTLRGGIPQDDAWARTPDQALVIASTVDQVGSRMLMQGYGVTHGMKPVHAGLLSNDTLLLLDEVHLSEPFRQTLDQVARLRQRFEGRGLKSRFCYAFLSATPGLADEQSFGLTDEEKGPESPLGPRLHASKPVCIIEVEDRVELEKECVQQAKALLERHRTIAVVVNRVASAGVIARQLEGLLGGGAVVALLTGRMRPLDRDDALRELRPAIQAGRARSNDLPKRVIVATQCIEAGADFDFDAIVTEAASLDSLRQRFGRVDRVGAYGKAEGVIIYDNRNKLREDLRRRGERPSLADEDPIYGTALSETARWLEAQEKKRSNQRKSVLKNLKTEVKMLKEEAKQNAFEQLARRNRIDFGVMALGVPTGDELLGLVAPKPDAPTLLPAYLDLWSQTSPAPSQIADVGLWLHGPTSGPPDVQVVWRTDLSEETLQRGEVEVATTIVAAIRPSSLEAVALPLATVCAWLTGQSALDEGDTEGASLGSREEESVDERGQMAPSGRRVLVWRGDNSEIVAATSLKPGDTIVVPASYGGIRNGCFDAAATDPVTDRAEEATFFARSRPVLRLHPAVLRGLQLSLPLDDADEARAALQRLALNEGWPAWKRLWAEELAKGRGWFVVPGEAPWTVIHAKRVRGNVLREVVDTSETLESGVELTTDADDSFQVGRSITLADHSSRVEEFAREYAMRCGLGEWFAEHLAMAAWLHDIGKADRRFQLMLRGGSEISYLQDATPWAKSGMAPGAREEGRLAQRRSGYPRGARHEVQSLAMLEESKGPLMARLKARCSGSEPDFDLVLHLVSSHHGYCRPLAPVVVEPDPVNVVLTSHKSREFGTIDFSATTSGHDLHRLDAPIADRFWALVGRYGWHELCWLEAIVRLADHRASEEEQS